MSLMKHLRDILGENVRQMPGTVSLRRGDRVIHPDLPGVHVVYSTAPTPEGNMVHVHPEHPDFDPDAMRNPTGINDRSGKRILHRVRASNLTKV